MWRSESKAVFSARSCASLSPNPIAEALARLRAHGDPILDLTESNPTRAGLEWDPTVLHDALVDPRIARYDPHPFGLLETREAIAKHWWAASRPQPHHMVLTPGTSDAYGYLLKLLCDPGDEVLVPQPGYPLLDDLARLERVALQGYPLHYDGAWHIDLDALRARVSERCKAIVVVNPNNPTGCYLHRAELAALAELGVPLISDEVFSPFDVVVDAARVPTILAAEGPLVFALGGLSKMLALPQLKLSWIAAHGPPVQVEEALARLELIADTYLSVSTPIQLAAPRLLDQKGPIAEAIHGRLNQSLRTLREQLEGSAATLLRVEGGWNGVVRLPSTLTELEWALALLEEDRVLVHPGWFYDFASEPFVVVSLLTPPATLAEGVSLLRRRVQSRC